MTTLKESILALREQGKTYSRIVTELGCTKGTVSYHLNPKVAEKVRASSKQQRARLLERINSIKESSPCVDCEQSFDGYLMDFDHLPEFAKVGNISVLFRSAGWGKVLEELAKCELVCCMCHRKRTKARWVTNPLTN